jgi:hypothetical protein
MCMCKEIDQHWSKSSGLGNALSKNTKNIGTLPKPRGEKKLSHAQK